MSSVMTPVNRRDAPATSRVPRRPGNRDGRAAAAFLAPNLILVAVFLFFPLVASVGIAFLDWDGISTPTMVGTDNFGAVVTDPAFRTAVVRTLLYVALSVPIAVVLSLAIAQALVRTALAPTFFRAAFFVPYVMSGVIVALLWRWFFNGNFGLFNHLLSLAGIQGPDWLNDPGTMMASVVIVAVWQQVGFNIVLFLVALQEVPRDLRLAAKVDGANAWQEFRHVTLPLISPVTFFVLANAMFTGFQVFDTIYVIFGGRPNEPVRMVVQYIYDTAFNSFQLGTASAAAVVYIAIIGVLTLLLWLSRRFWVLGEER